MTSKDLLVLDPANNEGYGSARPPCGRDDEVARIVRQVEGPSEFSEAKHAFGHGHGTVLSAFAERMATLAAREGSLQALRDGMSAEQLALAVLGDVRDSLPVLSLLFRALGYPGNGSAWSSDRWRLWPLRRTANHER